jgi:hypothetical protein
MIAYEMQEKRIMNYVDQKQKLLELSESDKVLLKLSP